jgi:hypothetical protein
VIIDTEHKLPEARLCVVQLIEIGQSVRMWLLDNSGFDKVMADLPSLNPLFIVFAPEIQAGFTSRLKSDQAAMRRLVIRMDTMRRTSYVSAGYLIAEVTALAIFVLLLVTQIGPLAPTLLVVGVITYLLTYVLQVASCQDAREGGFVASCERARLVIGVGTPAGALLVVSVNSWVVSA